MRSLSSIRAGGAAARARLSALAAGLLVASLAGCGGADSPTSAYTPRPTTIEIVTSPSGTSAAGLPLSAAPTFQVKDQNGAVMGGVAVSVSVTAGGGSVAGTPSATASARPTP